jgi:hypothetical protein
LVAEDDEFAEERRVAHGELRAQARELDNHNALAYLAGHQHGRKAVWDWLGHCNIVGASFSRDPGVMAFNEGRRDVGLWMLAQIETALPGTFALMQAEHQDREERYDAIQPPTLDEDFPDHE